MLYTTLYYYTDKLHLFNLFIQLYCSYLYYIFIYFIEMSADDNGTGDDTTMGGDDMWALFAKGLVDYDYESLSSSETEEYDGEYVLSMEIMTGIFNTTLEELTLLKRILNTPVCPQWEVTVKYATLEERFGSKDQTQFEETEFDKLNGRQKLLKDICFIYNIIRDGFNEILTDEKYDSITEAIQAMFQLLDDDVALLEEHAENLQRIKQLKRLIIREKRDFIKQIAVKKHEFFLCKNEYEDAIAYGRYKLRYVDDWEESRNQQNRLHNSGQENDYKNIIKESTKKMVFEYRVHDEITTWLLTNNDEMTEEINYWQHHYEEERDRWDLEIYNLKVARDQIIEELEEKKLEYDRHQVIIDDWNRWREEKRLREEYEEERLEALIKLQAWWRGLLVRKRWGPYRPRKGKKGKKGQGGLPALPGKKKK